MKIYNSKLLNINAEITNGYIFLNDEGPLKLLTTPILKKINNVFKQEKTIECNDNQLIFSSWIPPLPSLAFNRMIYAHLANNLFRQRIPDQLSISVTSKCPNKCIHCGASDILSTTKKNLEPTKIDDIIKSSLDLGTYLITIDGGEPLMREDILEIITKAQNEKSIISMFTSGYNLTEKKALEFKKAGLYSLKISLDSTIKEKHDKIRGRVGSYEEVINAIKASKKSKILTDLYLTISPYNIDELEDFYNFASEIKVDEMSITGIIAVGRWKNHEDEIITKKDIEKINIFHKEKNRNGNGPRVSSMPYLLGSSMFGCFAGQRWIHITNTGECLPCPYTPISFGNANDSSIKEIWKNMSTSKIYKNSFYECRMRNDKFRKQYINFEEPLIIKNKSN